MLSAVSDSVGCGARPSASYSCAFILRSFRTPKRLEISKLTDYEINKLLSQVEDEFERKDIEFLTHNGTIDSD